MKIRKSFVTNSSSASFVLTIKQDEFKTVEEFKRWIACALCLDDPWVGVQVEQDDDGTIELKSYTSMFNDYNDCPQVMREFVMINSDPGWDFYERWWDSISFESGEY